MEELLLGLRILAAAILYSFLGALLLMLRRDLRSDSGRSEAAKPSAKLIVIDSEERVLETGTTFPLAAVTSIGRGPGNTISIADSYASTHHALISWRGSQWWLEDQGSRNGTMLNGEPIVAPTVVASGDIVGVGRTAFRLEGGDGPGSQR
jgi:hypothetical protein